MENNLNNLSSWQRVTKYLLDIIFPRYCLSCSKEGSHLCPNCVSKIIKIKTNHCLFCQRIAPKGLCPKCKHKLPVEGIYSLGYYRDPLLRKAIQELKYQGIRDLAELLCQNFFINVQNLKLSNEITLITVPLHKTRYNERGFNQSKLIAESLCRSFNWKLENDLLVREKNTKPQAKLPPKDREANILNAFYLKKSAPIPKNIILIDDVITTGSTLKECVKLLRPHCEKIYILTLARG